MSKKSKLFFYFNFIFLFVGCQTVKKKQKLLLKKKIKNLVSLLVNLLNELKIDLGKPTKILKMKKVI